MTASIVCISRTIAARGEHVGQTVAQRLGFRYIDEQIIVRAAQLAQVDAKLVAATENRQPLLQRILDKLPAVPDWAGPITLAAGAPIVLAPDPTGYQAAPDDLRALIRAAIREIGNAGKVVIVAHAASMALAFAEGVLRVLVTASAETRSRRLAAAESLAKEQAAAAVATSDRARRDYFRHFYSIREELPTHYDLVINTDVLTPEQAADIIVSAAGSRAG